MDGSGDGVGDLQGVLEKLDYISSLNVDGIWFSPLYPSPNADFGYDVADYMDISPEYGDLELFRTLVEEIHARGMKILMDLVINHTSDQHPWFQASRRGEEPYRDYYFWRTAPEGKDVPNNWNSLFDGEAWTWDEERKAFYLHIFSRHQPDLNLRNPAVREEIKNIMRFWLDLGVDGFREDVISFISKPRGLPDGFRLMPSARGVGLYNHGPSVHAYLQEFRHDVLDKYDCLTIGETPMTSPNQALEYVREDGGDLDMVIQFETMHGDCFFDDYIPHPFFLPKQKFLWNKWQKALDGKGWNFLYLENHDHARIISRYGSEKFRGESGKSLCCSYLFQKGTPFIYQGQEIGMTNIRLDSIDWYEDVQTLNQYRNGMKRLSEEKRLKRIWRASRESARTPMQWSDAPNAGFSATEPWFYVNQNYREINVAQQEQDPDSLLNFYREAIALRKRLPVVRYGSYKDLRPLSFRLHVYERRSRGARLLVICSYSDKAVKFRAPAGYDLRKGTLLLHSHPEAKTSGTDCTLKPYECRVYLFREKGELPEGRKEKTEVLPEFYEPLEETPENVEIAEAPEPEETFTEYEAETLYDEEAPENTEELPEDGETWDETL